MILITGATGLVGSFLLKELIGENKHIRAIYRDEQSIKKVERLFKNLSLDASLLKSKVEWVKADLLDISELELAFEGVTHVYHCAAMVSFERSDKDLMFKVNIEGTANVVNLCLAKEVKKLCHVSSTAAIGDVLDENGFRNELGAWNANRRSNYSISKYYSELEVWRGSEEGLNVVIVNPSIIIGPSDWETGSSNLFLKVWKGLKYYSEGVNGFVDVRDVVKAMILLMNNSVVNERYLVIAENISFKQFFFQVADALGVKRPSILAKPWLTAIIWRISAVLSFLFKIKPIVTKESAESALSVIRFSNSKIKDAFDFHFTSIEASIAFTADVFKKEFTRDN